MSAESITTEAGTVVSRTARDAITLDHADAPADMRNIEAGRITYDGQGFQPAAFFPGAMRPDVLRAIADLIETTKEA